MGAEAIRFRRRRRQPIDRVLSRRFDIAVEATSTGVGVRGAIRLLKPGGVCTAVGYYEAPCTQVPLMHMYANDATLKLGVSHVRPVLTDLLEFVARTGFPAEKVTSLTASWDDAPDAYASRTTNVVLHRPPLDL